MQFDMRVGYMAPVQRLLAYLRDHVFVDFQGDAPMMAMAAELQARGADFFLHYCTRTPERARERERAS